MCNLRHFCTFLLDIFEPFFVYSRLNLHVVIGYTPTTQKLQLSNIQNTAKYKENRRYQQKTVCLQISTYVLVCLSDDLEGLAFALVLHSVPFKHIHLHSIISLQLKITYMIVY